MWNTEKHDICDYIHAPVLTYALLLLLPSDDYSQRQRSSLAPEYVTRILVPASYLARIIGRGGQQINSIRQTCGIRVETSDLSGDDKMVGCQKPLNLIVENMLSTSDLICTIAERRCRCEGRFVALTMDYDRKRKRLTSSH